MRAPVKLFGLLTLLAFALVRARTAEAGAAVAGAGARTVRLEILGLRVGDAEDVVHRRLRVLGTRREIESESEGTEGAAVERELWTLRDPDVRYLVVGLEGGRVVALQAHARPGRRALRYRDVGDPARARQLGFFIYQWTVPGRDGERGLRIEARGADPEYLGSYSIARDRARDDGAASSDDITRAGAESGFDPD